MDAQVTQVNYAYFSNLRNLRNGLAALQADAAFDLQGRGALIRQTPLHEADRLPGPLSAFRGLESRHGRALVAKARKAANPLAALRQGQGRQGPAVAWQAWQAARSWRKQVD